jgi:hypothetical protein
VFAAAVVLVQKDNYAGRRAESKHILGEKKAYTARKIYCSWIEKCA